MKKWWVSDIFVGGDYLPLPCYVQAFCRSSLFIYRKIDDRIYTRSTHMVSYNNVLGMRNAAVTVFQARDINMVPRLEYPLSHRLHWNGTQLLTRDPTACLITCNLIANNHLHIWFDDMNHFVDQNSSSNLLVCKWNCARIRRQGLGPGFLLGHGDINRNAEWAFKDSWSWWYNQKCRVIAFTVYRVPLPSFYFYFLLRLR